jgi:hypothetical protein
MGEVWQGFDQVLNRDVAIKVGQPQNGAPTLLEEGRAAAQLDHPNVVTVHDVDVHEGEPFIVMDYVAGPSLRRLLRDEGALPEPRAIQICGDVLNAIAYAHERGVWHNDVKPENILIGPEGRARLSDFGIASMSAATVELAEHRPRFATPGYAAPEVLAGSPGGFAADLYAVAITLYECIAGQLPNRAHGSSGGESTFVAPLRTLAPGASAALEAVLKRALDPDPANRYSSARALREAIEQSRSGLQPTMELGVGAAAAESEEGSSRARALGTIGLAAIAAGVVAGLAIWVLIGRDQGGEQPLAATGSGETKDVDTNPIGQASSAETPAATATTDSAEVQFVEGDFACEGAHAIRVSGDLRVPPGADCALSNSVVDGTIEVGDGANLAIVASSIRGNVDLSRGGLAQIADSTIDGNVTITRSEGAKLSGTTIHGNLDVDRVTDVRLVDSTINGNATIRNGDAAVVLGNIVDGNLRVRDNRTVEVRNNSVLGNLECNRNGEVVASGNSSPDRGRDRCG